MGEVIQYWLAWAGHSLLGQWEGTEAFSLDDMPRRLKWSQGGKVGKQNSVPPSIKLPRWAHLDGSLCLNMATVIVSPWQKVKATCIWTELYNYDVFLLSISKQLTSILWHLCDRWRNWSRDVEWLLRCWRTCQGSLLECKVSSSNYSPSFSFFILEDACYFKIKHQVSYLHLFIIEKW